eukprot:Mrub_04821.p1 GENE.Mrub_04821~~Mrub_04821.p1  ORF type:complete len:384 (+),score=158.33 Mrub_04821:42-1154(+)
MKMDINMQMNMQMDGVCGDGLDDLMLDDLDQMNSRVLINDMLSFGFVDETRSDLTFNNFDLQDLNPATPLIPHNIHYKIRIFKIATSLDHSCVLYTADLQNRNLTLKCWGGHNEFGYTTIPPGLESRLLDFAIGDEHTCLRLNWNNPYFDRTSRFLSNRFVCYGANQMGQAAVPSVDHADDYDLLAAGATNSCVGKQAGLHASYTVHLGVLCWGSDAFGQSSVPRELRHFVLLLSLSVGATNACAVMYDSFKGLVGHVVCWGFYSRSWGIGGGRRVEGRLTGVGGATDGVGGVGYGLRYDMEYGEDGDRCRDGGDECIEWEYNMGWAVVSTGFEHMCLVSMEGRARCVGDNEFGQSRIGGQDRDIDDMET